MQTQPQAPTCAGREGANRWELLRALGAAVLTPPPGNVGPCAALGLPAQCGVEHTRVFVLTAPPNAAIHLGPEGQLGGEGLDRVRGFWRALGLRAPEDADHLGTLLMLYAELGQAESGALADRVSTQLRRTRRALFHEHLWSWAPGYLAAVGGLGLEATAAWAELTEQALRAELAELGPAALLPLALRMAPPALAASDSFDETLDALVAPIRSGMILTYRDLVAGGEQAGVGVRRGERRYALKAMLLQDATATLSWLAEHARQWSQRHEAAALTPDDPGHWWAHRAAHSQAVLAALGQEAACLPPSP